MAPQSRKAFALLSILLTTPYRVAGIQVTPNSPCSSSCLDSPTGDVTKPDSSNTVNSDITCEDRLYGSTAGQKWMKCMNCLQNSTFVNKNENDQSWFLYNMRYGLSNCIFSFPNATGIGSTPCSTSTACGPLQDAFEDGLLAPDQSTEFSYCSANGGAMNGPNYSKCLACVGASGDTNFMANYIVALGAGCDQQPSPGKLVDLSGTLFTSATIVAVDPSATPQSTSSGGVATSTVVIIVIVIVVVIAAISALIFCRYRRRKKLARSVDDGVEKNARWNLGGRRPTSDQLSFQCRANILSPTFTPGNGSQARPFENMPHASQVGSGYTGPGRRASLWRPQISTTSLYGVSTVSPVVEEPPYFDFPPQEGVTSATKPTRKGPKGNSLTHTSAVPLHSLTTSIPAAPANVHSPPSAVARTSPLSASSTRSTASLLPRIKPYNPAGGEAAVFNSPSSATTTSPLLRTPINYGWPNFSNFGANPSNGEGPNGPKAPTPGSSPQLGNTQGGSTKSLFVPPTPPPKSPRHIANEANVGRKARRRESGSPIERQAIQVTFPPPPRR